jgi:cell division protein FtsB
VETLDFRVDRLNLNLFSRIGRLARPEAGLRAVVDRAPRAEALAASWIARIRPVGHQVYSLRRRIATVAVVVITAALFVHVMFGDNGMVVYKQKRAEYEKLKRQLDQTQQENDRYTQQIQGLKGDQKAIEKEAREQMGYAKPGEYVYVAPAPAKLAVPPVNHSTKK